MRPLRAIVRGGALIAASAVFAPVHALGLAATAGRPRARGRWQGRMLGVWSRTFLRILGVRVTWRGPQPEPPFLLAANHLGYLDILVLASRLSTTFVAKAEIASWPVLGPLCGSFGTLFLDRAKKSELPRLLAALEGALAAERGVVFFPEGTSSAGASVRPFRSPILALPAASGRGVHAAALAYRTIEGDPPAHLSVCWWGDTPFVPHFLPLLRLRRIEATVAIVTEPLAGEDRKRLALELREAVLGAFEPSAPVDFEEAPNPDEGQAPPR